MPADALFDWASVSKQFTAAAVLRLVDLSRLDDDALRRAASKPLADALQDKRWKKLSVDDPLAKFLPAAPADKAAVTLRQLFNHTSGIASAFTKEVQFDLSRGDALIECVLARPMTSKPGLRWEYSNSGYSFVAAILEKITGMTFENYCAEQLWKPAGMKSATMIGQHDLDPARVPKVARGAGFADKPKEYLFAYGNRLTWGYRGCGGIVCSTEDMLAWDRALRGGKILSKAALEELYRPGLKDYALGWEVKKVGGGVRVEHGGSVQGVRTYYMRHLDRDWVVALACSYEPKMSSADVAERLGRIVEKAE
jgi:CubicO group peptidase (beta-lactamase class C family)